MTRDVWERQAMVDHYAVSPRLERFEEEQVALFREGSSVLDIGCGTGRTTEVLRNIGFAVVGVDYSEPMVAKARELCPEAEFRVMDAARLEFEDESFGNVLFSYNGIDCLYPESKREAGLREIFRVLSPGGVFAFSSHNSWAIPNRRDRLHRFVNNLARGRILFSRYRVEQLHAGCVLLYHGSPRSQEKALERVGFGDVRVLGGKDHESLLKATLVDPYLYYVCRKK
jgi:SAM-dependent methyltransferase